MTKLINNISVAGTIKDITFDHCNSDCNIYRIDLESNRLSDTSDSIRINVPEYLVKLNNLEVGQRILVKGSVRTYKKETHLIIVVVAKELFTDDIPEQDLDNVQLSGYICKPVVFRKTPLGKYILEFVLAHNDHRGRSSYIPCIAWGSLAYKNSERSVGNLILINGRFQSRNYTKIIDGEQVIKTANEISASDMKVISEEELSLYE